MLERGRPTTGSLSNRAEALSVWMYGKSPKETDPWLFKFPNKRKTPENRKWAHYSVMELFLKRERICIVMETWPWLLFWGWDERHQWQDKLHSISPWFCKIQSRQSKNPVCAEVWLRRKGDVPGEECTQHQGQRCWEVPGKITGSRRARFHLVIPVLWVVVTSMT